MDNEPVDLKDYFETLARDQITLALNSLRSAHNLVIAAGWHHLREPIEKAIAETQKTWEAVQ